MSVSKKTDRTAPLLRQPCEDDGRIAACGKRVETRRAPRRPSNGRGFVRVAGYRMNIPCRIVDVSATGARLLFTEANAGHLPDRIVVAFLDRTEVDAEIRWRKERECGVRFLSFFRPSQTPSKSD